jgi:hypothetical protein
MAKRSSLITALLITILWGCTQPVKDFDFVSLDRDGYDTRDSVHLSVGIRDTTAQYTVYFSSRTDKGFPSPTIQAEAYITSPTGNRTSHYLEIPTDKLMKQNVVKSSEQNGIYDITWKWRDDFSAPQGGKWEITLHILNRGKQESYIINGIHEIGINIEPNERKR